MPWSEFRRCLHGLMACDSRIFRHFSQPDEPDGGVPSEW